MTLKINCRPCSGKFRMLLIHEKKIFKDYYLICDKLEPRNNKTTNIFILQHYALALFPSLVLIINTRKKDLLAKLT